MAKEQMTLASMCGGGVQERINRALAKISENILDPNTDGTKKRTLDIKIVFVPNGNDREDVAIEVQTTTKLAPEIGLKTQMFINKDFKTGVTTITEHAKGAIKGQITLDDLGYTLDSQKEEDAAEETSSDSVEEVAEETVESNKVVSLRAAN